MDFFGISKKLGLTSRETQEALKKLINLYPYGEHSLLTSEEIESELKLWLNERKWEKILESEIWL